MRSNKDRIGNFILRFSTRRLVDKCGAFAVIIIIIIIIIVVVVVEQSPCFLVTAF